MPSRVPLIEVIKKILKNINNTNHSDKDNRNLNATTPFPTVIEKISVWFWKIPLVV